MPRAADDELARMAGMARANRKIINRLKRRLDSLENALELVCDDPHMLWLYKNRTERMDPKVQFFDRARAEFHLARYEFASHYAAGFTVADIACGTGYGAAILAGQGNAEKVIGIDRCEQTIKYAQLHYANPNIEYQCGDAEQCGLPDESIDLVVSFETIEHVNDDQALLAEFRRILKPDGHLICSTPNDWPLDIAPHHIRVYQYSSFMEVLDRDFTVEKVFNQNSGSDSQFNHDQPAGIIATTEDNRNLAECYIAVARAK